jgi:glyoxylase-like metal-dependent hydrolase (beta-lactamase superfamily II)
MKFEKIDFKSHYFDIYELNKGIYATIFKHAFGGHSNAGFFDLGNRTIVFDTLMDPFATRDLINASKSITKKEPFLLINSHFHMDHVFGNRLFHDSTPILSSLGTLNQFDKGLLEQFMRFKEIAPAELEKTKELLKKEKDPDKKIELNNDLITYKEVLEPNFQFRPPDLLLHNKMVINGTEGSVEIINVGNAHSYDDLIAYFPKEKICFMGDLLFDKLDPEWASDSSGMSFAVDVINFKRIMESYLKKDIETYIPGHGVLCSKKEVKVTIEYLDKYFINK